MNNISNYTCSKEKVYSKYELSNDKKYITITDDSDFKEYCPYDNLKQMVTDYLIIGYKAYYGIDFTFDVLNFIKTYGMPERRKKKLNISDFSEDAMGLYLHFSEINTKPYPKTFEWVLDCDPVGCTVVIRNDIPYIMWNTKSLSSAIELGYSQLLCNPVRLIGLCKHCKMPFIAENPKTEFCSGSCRNKYNVYKSRSKNKK